jgi:hypothetical protein
MAESILDPTVVQSLNTGFAKEAAGAADSRTRAWDEIAKAVAVQQTVYIASPSVMTGQGIRMLNGTPGQFANAVPATP